MGYEPGGSTLSLDPTPRHLSNRPQYPWVVVIVLVLMMAWPPAAEAVSVYVDAVAVVALFAVGSSTAAKYSNSADL